MTLTAVALIYRLLWNGMSPKDVAESTGEDLGEVLELQMELPERKAA